MTAIQPADRPTTLLKFPEGFIWGAATAPSIW
jgi:hypothetical protein